MSAFVIIFLFLQFSFPHLTLECEISCFLPRRIENHNLAIVNRLQEPKWVQTPHQPFPFAPVLKGITILNIFSYFKICKADSFHNFIINIIKAQKSKNKEQEIQFQAPLKFV